jgi:hypothetical protein
MSRGEKTTAAGMFMALLFATGIDSPTGYVAATWLTIICLGITGVGLWLLWIDAGRKESIRRTKEIRRSGKIAAEDRWNSITTRSTERGRVHNRDSDNEKGAAREVI